MDIRAGLGGQNNKPTSEAVTRTEGTGEEEPRASLLKKHIKIHEDDPTLALLGSSALHPAAPRPLSPVCPW
jgi:hypothetical protein